MSFQTDVECYTAVDPMPTLQNLSTLTGVPVEKIVKYVLVKYAASASDALLAMDPIVFRQMRELVTRAEDKGTDTARLEAYHSLKSIIAWLGLEPDHRAR